MQIQCKNCGATIPAENVNIHDMVAVCPKCDHVFKFGDRLALEKVKRRKVKHPDRVHVQEAVGRLDISYSRVLSQDDAKGMLPLTILTLIMLFLFGVNVGTGTPILFHFLLGSLTAIFSYLLVEAIFNRTEIRADDQTITVCRKPLPLPGAGFPYQTKTLSRDEAVEVFAEETAESREKGDVNRYYHVCAQLPDGSRVILIKGAPQTYGLYIAQRLEAYLQGEESEAIEALADDTPAETDTVESSPAERRQQWS